MVVDKPVGVITHQASSFKGDDVYHMLVDSGVKIETSGDEYRQGIVSRLDIGTSGVLVVAKNENSYQHLKAQFSSHSAQKVYYALAVGSFASLSGRISAPIGRHPNPKKRSLFAVVEGGKEAVTDFDVLATYAAKNGDVYSLLRIRLHTGRTHQIRVHLSAYGHPLVGDPLYSTRRSANLGSACELSRPFLHSGSLTIKHPETGALMTFKAAFPDDLRSFLLFLKKK